MKTTKSISLTLTALALATATMTSCDDPTYPSDLETTQEGTLSLSGMTVSVNSSENEVDTRSSVDVSTFTVNINNSDGELVQTYTYSSLPEIVTLTAGTYTVEAYNEEEQEAAFEAPYYYGTSGSVTVVANDITNVDEIVCSLANVKVGIFYSDELAAVMGTDVAVTVTVADTRTLTYSYDETRAGYFKVSDASGTSTLLATFNGTVDGYTFSDYKVLTTDVEAGNYLKITFSLKETPSVDLTGSISGSSVTVDATVTRYDISGNADPGDEDIIDGDEFLTLGYSSLSFTSDAQTAYITVSASSSFTATSDASWCTLSDISTSGFTVNVEENTDTASSRSATITVTSETLEKTIAVSQEAYTTWTGPTFYSEYIDLTSGEYNDASEYGTSGKPATVVISAPNGIKTAHVTIDSDILTASELASIGLSDKFELTTGLSDDGSDLSLVLAGLGFPIGSDVLNQTEVTFDITTFVPLLCVLGTSKSTFELEVTDNKDLSATAYLRFEVK